MLGTYLCVFQSQVFLILKSKPTCVFLVYLVVCPMKKVLLGIHCIFFIGYEFIAVKIYALITIICIFFCVIDLIRFKFYVPIQLHVCVKVFLYIKKHCEPISEAIFRQAINANYYTNTLFGSS